MLYYPPDDHSWTVEIAPLVGVVLINYKRSDLTLGCVESLKQLSYPNIKVFVVENGSDDGSLENLSVLSASLGFKLIPSSINLGFSGGCNLGINAAIGESASYIWLLNNDAQVLPDTLDHLIDAAIATRGLISSPLYYLDENQTTNKDGKLQTLGLQFNFWTTSYRVISTFPSDGEALRIDSLTGASLLIPAKIITQIGLMDEQYFLYFEDSEYTLRAKHQGFPVHIAAKAKTLHHLSASTGGRQNPAIRYYIARNRLLFGFQYASLLQKASIFSLTVYKLLKRAFKALLNNPKRRLHHRQELKIEILALLDFITGRFGPCRHTL